MGKIYVGQMAKDLELELITPEVEIGDIEIHAGDINRPALQLAGFYDHFESNRVQIIGNVEYAYVVTKPPESRAAIFARLFETGIPCLIYCRGLRPGEAVRACAVSYGVPILVSNDPTSEFYLKLLTYIQDRRAPEMTIHGELIDVFGEGVLITGESGIGKSEAALELIKRGHRLVADDAVCLRRVNATTLKGSAPEVTRHFIELRGIGIIDVKTLFGVESVEDEMKVDLNIHLEEWDRNKTYDRLGTGDKYVEYLGNKVVCYSIPIRPGRNLAVIVESAAVNYRQRQMGYDATEELYKRVRASMTPEI